MLNRSLSVVACVCLAAGTLSYGQNNQGNSYLFQLPGAGNPGATAAVYTNVSNNLGLIWDNPGPAGSFQIAAMPDGSKFYILGSGASALQIIDSTFPSTPRIINGLPSTPTAMVLTPNGQYLLAGGNELDIISTSTDQLAAPSIPVNGTVIGIAASRDSSRALVLTTTNAGSSITIFNLTTQAATGQVINLPANPTSIALAPSGLIYATTENAVWEIDPVAGALNNTLGDGGHIGLAGNLGQLQFSPDGTTAYAVNSTPAGTAGGSGGALVQINLTNHTVFNWPASITSNPPIFTQVLVAGNNRIFAVASPGSLSPGLYDVTPAPLAATTSTLSTAFPASQTIAIAASNEVPTASKLFALTVSGQTAQIWRLDLGSNTDDFQVTSAFPSGVLQFSEIPEQTGVTSFYQFNNFQTVQPGFTSLPLVAQLLDAQNRPVFNVPATFTVATGSGVTVSTPTITSDSNGYVETTAVAPTTPGPYVVTLTAGGVTTTFTFTVPCNPLFQTCSTTGTGGTGTGSGSGGSTGSAQHVTIVSGDGQLVPDQFGFPTPLELNVTDATGKPLSNVAVSFSLTSGTALACAVGGTTTDVNGNAIFDLCGPSPLSQGVPFETDVITATTQFGTAAFHVTVVSINANGTGGPDVVFANNDSSVLYASGQAGVIQADTFEILVQTANNTAGPLEPIPNLGMSILNFNDPTMPPPAVCANPKLSGTDGVIHCNLQPACMIGTYPFTLAVAGDLRTFTGQITITQGSASAIKIVSGNNQSSTVGQPLAQPLVAQVTDACGNPASGNTVTWAVSGSATLVSPTTMSDSNGDVTTKVTLGQVPGPVTVTATLGTTSVTFQIGNSVTIAGISLTSGGGQSAILNQPFTSPLIFNVVDTNSKPVSGATVNFGITSGTGSLSAGTATTDTNGNASVTVTAGANTGNLVITATVNTFSATATLSIRQQGPAISASSFANYASGAPGLVPCGLATLTGQGISAGLIGSVGSSGLGPYLYTVGGFSLTINNVPAPIQQISNVNGQQQVTFQTPCETPVGSVSAIATSGGTPTTVSGIPVYAAQPGIISTVGSNGKSYGAVVSVANGTSVSASNPLIRGQQYYLLVTGLGQTTPATATNAAGVQNETVQFPVIVGVDNAGVPVSSVTYQPGSIGIYAVEFEVPLNAPTGTDQPLAIGVTVNGQLIFGNPVFLAAVN